MLLFVILALVAISALYAMIYGAVIFLGAFVTDDQTLANHIGAHGLMFFVSGLVALIAVIVILIRRSRQARR